MHLFSHGQGENPFTGNQDDQDPEDSMVMDMAEQELAGEAADSQTDEAPIKAEEETGQEEVEGEAAGEEDEKMEEELLMEGDEEQVNQEEEEGFEVGEEEEGYVVRDEIGEGLQGELEDEGVEATEVEEDKNDE